MKQSVTIDCKTCEARIRIYIDMDQYQKWKGGQPIQTAMPDLDDTERGMVMHRRCKTCKAEQMGEI